MVNVSSRKPFRVLPFAPVFSAKLDKEGNDEWSEFRGQEHNSVHRDEQRRKDDRHVLYSPSSTGPFISLRREQCTKMTVVLLHDNGLGTVLADVCPTTGTLMYRRAVGVESAGVFFFHETNRVRTPCGDPIPHEDRDAEDHASGQSQGIPNPRSCR